MLLLSPEMASQAGDASSDPNQDPVQSQQSDGGQMTTTNQTEDDPVNPIQAAVRFQQTEQDEVEPPLGNSADKRGSQSRLKSASRPGKENINSSTPLGKKNASSGPSNKFCALADLVDEPQKVRGCPLRDRKLSQKATDSKSQYGKKKVMGEVGGATGLCPKI